MTGALPNITALTSLSQRRRTEGEQAKIRQDILPSNRSVDDPTEDSPERAFAYEVSKYMADGWFMLAINPSGDPLQIRRSVTARVALVEAPGYEELIPGRRPIWSLTLRKRVYFGHPKPRCRPKRFAAPFPDRRRSDCGRRRIRVAATR